MKLYTLWSLLLIQIVFAPAIFGQQKLSKVFSPDNTIISKDILQKRDIRQYFDGGAFRCGMLASKGECDYKKIREVIWQCWNEKSLCYLTITVSGVDSGGIEHIFVESNLKKELIISRRTRTYHAIIKRQNRLHNLPKVYSIEWSKNGEETLILKNKSGKVIGEY
jgi:hypothetical protein